MQDLTCPFCGSERRDVLSARIPKGLSRAAAHAARAALILGAASTGACYESHGLSDAGDAAVVDAPLARVDASADVPLIDAPAPPDARADISEGDAGADAGDDADVGAPIYGGVFPDPRKRAIV